jgi:primosomal protein N' (replication factor Y) (superfamily II helicase)
MKILHIAVPTPLHHHFDYLAPDNVDISQLKPGIRVRVPWRKSEVIGVLLNTSEQVHVAVKKLKKAISILDDQPLFPETMLRLIQFSSDYYQHPIGEVFAAAFPTLLRQGRSIEYRHQPEEYEALPEVAAILTDAQAQAVSQILAKSNGFQSFLLFGVTGSGKTEVYLQVISEILKQDKQALVLVPEIGLTPQTVARFQKRFPVPISVLHSGLTDKERHDAWLQAKNGDAKIVIGTRSVIFTPLKKPGIIILDEEHDLSFKQQDGFRYSARDLAIMRAQLEKIPVVLGSATPSLESFHNVALNRYQLLTLPERAGSAVHPTFHVVDLRKQAIHHGFSIALIERIKSHLKNNGQVLVFLNRRGFAPTLICHDCGWIALCKRCDANMIVHRDPLHLQCHQCGASRNLDKSCGDCGKHQLFPLGAGTERVEETLLECFPKVPIIRVDRDTTRKKGALEIKLAEIHEGEPCIMVGTQMLAKGHHFPNVTLAVILNVDSGWFSSDFRGAERTAQLILQVAGRAGRVEKPGEVILQTYHPGHPLLQNLLKQDYQAFANAALQERQQAGLPPYQSLALIRSEALSVDSAMEFLREVKSVLQQVNVGKTTQVFGPIPAPMQKRAGKHRAQLLLQSAQRKNLKYTLDGLLHHYAELKRKQRVRWSIDVDPQDMF